VIDPLNIFTTVLTDAPTVDGPLAGTSFAAKDLYDVAGHVTLAGSKSMPMTANWPRVTPRWSRG
jgi:Asp-tRNA(Asn)/Glu-tRNA(Gln) amidotransferase A subunit family amidase